MANSYYDKGRRRMAIAAINWESDTIKIALVGSGYAVNLATHEYYTDLGANVVGSYALAGELATAGNLTANDLTISAPGAGLSYSYIVVYKDTGSGATSPLLMYFDTVTGLPYTTDNNNVLVKPSASGFARA